MKQLAVFGFGLIGASLAAAVRAADPGVELVAIDLPEVVGSESVRALANRSVPSGDRDGVRAVAASADLCVLAAPVSVIRAELPGLLECARVVTDCGSTKRSICAAVSSAPRLGRFVPGHPMAGGPEGGAALARADLFRGQTWLLCPDHCDADALSLVETLIAMVGAQAVHMALDAHDRAVAYTSHAPQVLASALAVLTAEASAVQAAGPAYRATTRSAGGAERMWQDIFSANADEISLVLRQLSTQLLTVAAGLETTPPDTSAALKLLAKARATRRS
jgi:prephenate dehydrogenase